MSFAVICTDQNGRAVAMVDRNSHPNLGWWTSSNVGAVMRFINECAAEAVVARLKHNNPRVVRFDAAVKLMGE